MLDVDKLSNITTLYLCAFNTYAVCDPINPKLPINSIFIVIKLVFYYNLYLIIIDRGRTTKFCQI